MKVGRGATTAGTSVSTTRHSDRENLGFLGLVQAHLPENQKQQILRAQKNTAARGHTITAIKILEVSLEFVIIWICFA